MKSIVASWAMASYAASTLLSGDASRRKSLHQRGARPEEIGDALGLRKPAVYKLLRYSDDEVTRKSGDAQLNKHT